MLSARALPCTTFVAPQHDYLEFETGPTETLMLNWATYYDAADEAGISRLYGGIHPAADDFPARIMGSLIGKKAFAEALTYFDGGTGRPDPPEGVFGISMERSGGPRLPDTVQAPESVTAPSPRPSYRDPRVNSRHALLRALDTSRNLEVRLIAARGLVSQADVSLHGLLRERLEEIRHEARQIGRRDLVGQATALLRIIRLP